MEVTSTAFELNGLIPSKYTCDGEDVNPPLTIKSIPSGTKSLVLIVDDPDAPGGVWTHWIVWNIPPGDIKKASAPGVQGMNNFGKKEWGGPCPPGGTHRYYFRVFALDTELTIQEGALREELEKAMEDHILARGQLMARYVRK
jgi:Raf kinase inhibitor-like YbhB/YbcL family protein